MPTLSGWGVLTGGMVFVAAGRIFGTVEFLVVGVAGLAAMALAVLVRLLRPSRLSVSRRLAPPRVAAGDSAAVELVIRNLATTASPLLVLHDAVSESSGVTLSLAPIGGRASARAAYRLPTARRGVIALGPVRIDDVDAVGLVRRRHRIENRARLLVHPPVEALRLRGLPAGNDPFQGPELRPSLGMSDEEFDGLREYVPGDDLRKIHWRSSARMDDLQVRQFRPPHHGRLSVVIDTRPPGDQRRVLDITTSMAASIAAAGLAEGHAVRVQAGDGRGTPAVSGTGRLDVALEFLALLAGGAEQIHPSVPDADGTVIAVSADPRIAADEAARRSFALRLRADVVVTVDAEAWRRATSEPHSSGNWIHVTGPGQLGACWDRRRAAAARQRRADPAPSAV